MREKVGKNDDSKPFGGSREVASRTAENPKQCRMITARFGGEITTEELGVMNLL
jgi:hypothetical protein